MTMRNASLTAIAALTVALAGGAIAQDASTATGTAPAGSSYQGNAATAPAADAAPATTAPAEAAAEAPAAAEPAAATPAEAVAPDPLAETAAADQSEASVADQGQVQPEPTETAEDVSAAQADAPAGNTAETAVEAESAPEPTASEGAGSDMAADEAVDEAAAEHAAAEPAAAEHAAKAPAASHEAAHIEDVAFSFEGPFGKFDQFQLQRGLQVYTEVCAGCHGLRYVPLRTLADPGGPELPEDQVRAYAAQFDITDAETGEDRSRIPTDHFPTVSGDGMGPDLSLMAKARAAFHGPYGSGISQLFNGTGGPEYIHAVLTGYNGETKEEAGSTFYHNAAFAGNWIQMPQPLTDDQVTYEDGTPATVDQMSKDVAAFLMWTAEPKMMDRKQVGFVSVIFLVLLSALLYLTNKKLWWSVKHPRKPE